MGWQPDPRNCPPCAVPPRSLMAPRALERMRRRAEADGLDLDDVYASKAFWDRKWIGAAHRKPWWPFGAARRLWREQMDRADDGARKFGQLLIGWMQS